MKITIEKITLVNGSTEISFSSELGNAIAQWVGDLPAPGEVCDVELDVDDDLVWGQGITTTENNMPMISSNNKTFSLVGKVLAYEEDGCLSIALGDSVVLLDVESAPKDLSGMIECKASTVRLFPTNL